MNPISLDPLRSSFAALRAQGLRARDAARQLGLSEGAVMAAHAVSQMSPQQASDSLLAGDLAPLSAHACRSTVTGCASCKASKAWGP
ncbi:MAG: hypothetical protein IV107_16205 [Paucibacter sp.]|nr:hypothetical protein [Roseateles sp.]